MYKYTFDKNRGRVKQCPCGKNNRDGKFEPLIGFETKGRCWSCGDYFWPDDDRPRRFDSSPNQIKRTSSQRSLQPLSTIDHVILKRSMSDYKDNNFVTFLISHFGLSKTEELIKTYFIGTSDHWRGGTVFWYLDRSIKVRTGKVMLYNKTTGKRVKEPHSHITWIHSLLKLRGCSVSNCLFGEHLISTTKDKPIGIVESEKTAVIASVYYPGLTWLATGCKSCLTVERLESLIGRNIILFPDLGALDVWQQKATEFSQLASVSVSTILEDNATTEDRVKGLDLADYLLKYQLPS